MAIESLPEIHTNVPFNHLERVAAALVKGEVKVVPGSVSRGNEGASQEFEFEGAIYHTSEAFEKVNVIRLISGKPDFVQGLIDRLIGERSIAIDGENYDKAKELNERIKNLKGVLTSQPSSN